MFPRVDGLRSIEFGSPGTSRENLVNLVLHGTKRATAGLLSEYEAEGEAVEHVVPRSCSSPHLVVLQQVGVYEHTQLSAVTKGGHATIGL